ncbi:MAG TPA: hypothetical protein DCL38_10960 [Lachnospiraceae bacterium]|nr:hypothetical protein [Lachnospiraceae bacterium]
MNGSVSYREFKRRDFIRRKRRAEQYLRSNKHRFIFPALIFLLILIIGIFAGTRLIYASSDPVKTGPAAVGGNTYVPVKCYKSVMIYLGDTLESISVDNLDERYYSIDTYRNEIRRINHISDETVLIPGNYLVVPCFSVFP